MADNTTLNAGTGGDVIGSDDIGGVKFQRVKLIHGADGVNDGDVASGNPLPVAVGTALPAGDNNIGNVDVATLPAIPAGNNNIGDVDIATVPAPLSTTGNGAAATALRVTVANDSTGVVSATLTAGTNTNEVVGDAAHDAAVAGNPLLMGGYASAAAPTDVGADGRAVRDWNLRNGAKATVITAAGALIDGDATNGLDVDVTRLPALVAGTANIGDVDVLTVPAPLSTTGGGTEATALRVTVASDSTGVLSVDDNAGSLTVDAPIGTPVNVQIGNATLVAGVIDETGASAVDALAIGGGTAHDAVNSGNPIQLGGHAVAHGTNPTGVAAADRTHLIANRAGILFTIGGHPNAITRSVRIADANNAQTDLSIAGTISAGTKVAITAFTVTCSAANTVNVAVKLGFGTANIPADSTTGASGILFDHEGIAPGSGVSVGNGSGILGIGADDEEFRLTCDDPVGGFVIVSFTYFTIES